MAEWVSTARCCTAPALARDLAFGARTGPTSERVVRCSSCGARWIEEWSTVAGFERDDRDYFRYRRVDEDEASRLFGDADHASKA